MKKHNPNIAKTNGYKLAPDQEKQMMIALAECNNPNNLVSHEEAVFQIETWLNRPITSKNSDGYNDLTPQQKIDLEEAIAETYHPTKLIDHEDVMKKYKKWLK